MSKHLEGVDRVTAADIVAVLAEVCPSTVVRHVHPGPQSYANRLWRAETDEGDLLVRVPGRHRDPEIFRAAMVASRIAHEAGVPTSRFRAFAPTTKLGYPIVVQEFGPGERASPDTIDATTLGRALGDWVGRLHSIRRPLFGSVLDTNDERPWGMVAFARVQSLLAALPPDVLPAGRDVIAAAFARYRAIVTDGGSLTHGDLYLDNVLVHDGRPSCLLDFEHASFQDRFADFGKLKELVFEGYPATERPFMDAYRAIHPPTPDDDRRMALSLGVYALQYLHYFHTWQPDLIDFYRNRLDDWLAGETAR